MAEGNGKVRQFEDLIAWQKARELTRLAYLATDEGGRARDFGLRDQMRQAAVSIMSNIAEGHDRQGPNEFMHFLSLAAGSCAELRSQLYVAQDVGYLSAETFADLNQRCVEVSRILAGLMASLKRSRARG